MARTLMRGQLSWLGVFRLGLVQAALGAIVIVTTSTLNRVMVVELALPAMLPGALVGWHYAIQISRPHWGHRADQGGRRGPWIVGGIAVLGLGAVLAAVATTLLSTPGWPGLLLAVVAFSLIGAGVGAAGTNQLALLAARTPASRKAAAAAIVWIMMIVGFVITAVTVGAILDPFTMSKLVQVTALVSSVALVVAFLAVLGLERHDVAADEGAAARADERSSEDKRAEFLAALRDVWDDQSARRFTIFVFVSMLAYSAQDLILEPFAGLIHGYTPGQSTALAGTQNGGVLLGMIATAIAGTVIGKSRPRFMRNWTIAGCLASAISLALLAIAATAGNTWPLEPLVFLLGMSNGAFTVAAIGSMMTLASAGPPAREGIRMGLWGASQAIAFGLGGFLGAVALDVMRTVLGDVSSAFFTVFAVEGGLFAIAALLAFRVGDVRGLDDLRLPVLPAGEHIPAE